MRIQRFTDLTVWQRAHELTLLVYGLTDHFPRREHFGTVAQIRRSAASVPANIAEGFGRRTTKELLRSLQIALGEVEETRYFLILSRDLRHITQLEFDTAAAQSDAVAKLINALATSLRKRLPVS